MVFIRLAAALTVLLATLPATGAPPRCREVPAADALRRLAVWGREWAGGRGPIIARASWRVAVLAGCDDAMREALFWVALDRARGPVETPPGLLAPASPPEGRATAPDPARTPAGR